MAARRRIHLHWIYRAAIFGILVLLIVWQLPPHQAAIATSLIEPNAIPGIMLWLDASDPDGDSDATNNPSDGAALVSWADKSGAGHNANVLTGKQSGAYRSAASELINSQSVIHFNRIDQHQGTVYEIPGVDIRATANEDVTIITVYRPTSIAAASTGLWGNDNGNWDRFFLSYNASFGDGVDDGLASRGQTQHGVTVPDAGQVGAVRLMTAVYNGAVANGVNHGPTNGSLIAFDGKTVVRFTDSTDDVDAINHLSLGWDGDEAPFDGDIAEMIVYNRALNGCEIQEMNRYLGMKYGRDFARPTPGGVNDMSTCPLNMWLKADAGVFSDAGTTLATDGDHVQQWNDQSGSDNILTEAHSASTSHITFTTDVVNFHPTVQFDGTSNQRLAGTAAAAFSNDGTIIAVVRADGEQTNVAGVLGTGPTEGGQGIYVDSTGQYVVDGAGAWEANSANTPPAGDQFHVVTGKYVTDSTSNSSIYLDGERVEQATGGGVAVEDTNTGFEIGGRTSGSLVQRIFKGRIAEVIYYSNALTDADRIQVESYLAIKYGITLTNTTSYVASDGATVIWDRSANADYYHAVAGIGVDMESALRQLKSRSINADDRVMIAGDALQMASGAFLVWGNDNADSDGSSTQVPAGYSQRLLRTWKAQETGETDELTVTFDLSGFPGNVIFSNPAAFAVLQDSDGDFSNATAVTGATVAGTSVSIGNLNLQNGEYFTLAYPAADTTPPAAPIVMMPVANITIGSSQPTIIGTAEADSIVIVKEGDATLCATTALGDGTWSCTPSAALPDGAHTISVTATDGAGNVSLGATHSFTIDTALPMDTTPPDVPTLMNPMADVAYGSIRPIINGTAEGRSLITVQEGPTTLCTIIVWGDGRWSCTPSAALTNGTHTISITATDGSGNVSLVTMRSFVIDTSRPVEPTVTIARSDRIAGMATPGTTVIVTLSDGRTISVPVDANGNWSYTFNPTLPTGTTVLVAGSDGTGKGSANIGVTIAGYRLYLPVVKLTR